MTDVAARDGFSAALSAYRDLERWLFDAALPLWSTVGTDRVNGGFFEKIDRRGAPVEEPRRTRVVGRQIYAYATGGRINWQGPATEIVTHGLDYFFRCCLATDGTVVMSSRPTGEVVDGRFDLYDHAFALFGLAAAHRLTPDRRLVETAERMRTRMREGWGHPSRGFEESVPRTLPLKANPHMHVFEAALAWIEALDGRDADGWYALADEIAELCLDRFIDPKTGALREFFDGEWNPIDGEDGRLVEPGHQSEWAWLLYRWGWMRGDDRARTAAARLVDIAEDHGTDPERGITFNELWDDLSVRNLDARLWPQTERIKAWLARARDESDPVRRDHAFRRVALASDGLKKYLEADVNGAWNERMKPDGTFLDEPSPASSLYHITCAIAEMHDVLAMPR